MAENRIKVVVGPGIYHCMTRTVAGERLLGVHEKEVLRKMLWDAADFSGVEVLAYCLLTNHFHILVRVPEAPETINREELLRRYRVLYGERTSPGFPDYLILKAIFAEDGDEATLWEKRLRARMYDVSAFMKTVKQRFSVWYNKSHRRFGTLWAERFRSVLVEDSPFALKTVAAYIDLNAVRAGLAEDPGEYRWCSYAEAMSGYLPAQAGLAKVVGASPEKKAREYLAEYRIVLFGKGSTARESGKPRIPADKVAKILESGGTIETEEMIRHRTRYLTEGVILGSAAFVEEIRTTLANAATSDERTKSATIRHRPRRGKVCLQEGELTTLRRPRARPSLIGNTASAIPDPKT